MQVANPLSKDEKITMVSTGDGPLGAARITDDVMHVMTNAMKMVNDMSGIDMSKVGLGFFQIYEAKSIFGVKSRLPMASALPIRGSGDFGTSPFLDSARARHCLTTRGTWGAGREEQ